MSVGYEIDVMMRMNVGWMIEYRSLTIWSA